MRGQSPKKYNSVQMLEKLVSFDTTSWRSNLELIDFVADYLGRYDIPFRIFYDEEQAKANLFATIGPADQAGIILSGHTDVVPVDGQTWATDPFSLTSGENDEGKGRLYGRGTSDMKGFIACALAMVPAFLSRPLSEPLHLALSYDEEVGCTGVHSLVDYVAERSPRPRACIVGEPTSMKVVNAHKGICAFHTSLSGREAHSSTDRGVNALHYGAEIVAFLSGLADEYRQNADENSSFVPPYTTVHVGRMTGGVAVNITPSSCEFDWEYRCLPGMPEREISDRVEAFIDQNIRPRMNRDGEGIFDVTTEQVAYVPPLVAQTGSSAETLVLALAGRNETEVVSYGTEAGIFQENGGVPTVVCGPGSIQQAHRPNEYIEQSQLQVCDDFLQRLCDVMQEQEN
ncbi:MAG: acetylornithine deacetylase [Kordiimonas sp.]|nr:acetylornithine deacetylase [Kordiimonas sp.]